MEEREFRRLYDTHSRSIYNYILWLTRNRQAGEDILQTVFVKLWKHRPRPDESENIEGWLFRVAHNACLDHFRRCRRFSKFRLRYARERDTAALLRLPGKETWDILTTLSESERSVLYLHMRMGYSYREIGTMLDMTENNVRVRAFRALRRLRKEYAGKS